MSRYIATGYVVLYRQGGVADIVDDQILKFACILHTSLGQCGITTDFAFYVELTLAVLVNGQPTDS